MVYHLKHLDGAGFIMDMLCYDPKGARAVFEEIHKEAQLDMHIQKLIDAVTSCTCTKTKEGFEACLNINREDFIGRASGGAPDPRFEKFLELLDKQFGGIKEDYAGDHIL